MNRAEWQLRPEVIAAIGQWWQGCLRAASARDQVLTPPDVAYVAAKFGGSEEEAIRGLSVGEHLQWQGED